MISLLPLLSVILFLSVRSLHAQATRRVASPHVSIVRRLADDAPFLMAVAILFGLAGSAFSADAKRRTISASVELKDEGEDLLAASALSDINAGLCAQAQLAPGCSTKELQDRTGNKDARLFASLDEWGAAVLAQAKDALLKQQAQRLRTLAEAKDAEALKAAAKKALGQQ